MKENMTYKTHEWSCFMIANDSKVFCQQFEQREVCELYHVLLNLSCMLLQPTLHQPEI